MAPAADLNDHYNGGNPNQPSDGNPWVLCTAGLADIYYRAASQHAQEGVVTFTDTNSLFFQQVLDFAARTRAAAQRQPGVAQPSASAVAEAADVEAAVRTALAQRGTLSAADPTTRVAFARVLAALTLSGDGIMIRIRHHVQSNNFHLPEELNKDTGASQGAHDLTWSYGTVVGAMNSRKAAAEVDVPNAVGHALATHMMLV